MWEWCADHILWILEVVRFDSLLTGCVCVWVLFDLVLYHFTDDPLVLKIAELYKLDRESHDRQAIEWTERYAT
jgi:ubiquitin-protein ligase